MAAVCQTVLAQDLAFTMGIGKFTRAELDKIRPLFAFGAMYTPLSAQDHAFYPEIVLGYWSAEGLTYRNGSVDYNAAALDDCAVVSSQANHWKGVYSGVRIVADDERRARREGLVAWPAVGIGGIIQWTDPALWDHKPRYRALGFLRVSFRLEGSATMFLEAEGQTDFKDYYLGDPGIEGVLKIGHRFRL